MKLYRKGDRPLSHLSMEEVSKINMNPPVGKVPDVGNFDPQPVNESKMEAIGEDGPKPINESAIKLDSVDPNAIKDHFGWLQQGDNYRIIPRVNTPQLPPGYYSIREHYNEYYLEKKYVFLDELFLLPDATIQNVVEDIQTFWQRKDKYHEYGITYKRGILLHGPPGTGKSSVINFLIHILSNKFNGIIFDYCYGCEDMIRQVRLMQPEMPIMVIMEDIDGIISGGGTSHLLNLLDGNSQIDNIVYLATTNYMDRIEPRFKNRPSRFDRKFEIGFPTTEVREFFIQRKLKEHDLNSIDIGQWVQDTENMTLAHIKELIVSVIVMNKDYNDVIRILKEMNEEIR